MQIVNAIIGQMNTDQIIDILVNNDTVMIMAGIFVLMTVIKILVPPAAWEHAILQRLIQVVPVGVGCAVGYFWKWTAPGVQTTANKVIVGMWCGMGSMVVYTLVKKTLLGDKDLVDISRDFWAAKKANGGTAPAVNPPAAAPALPADATPVAPAAPTTTPAAPSAPTPLADPK